MDQSKEHSLITERDGLEICWQPCLHCFRVLTFHPPSTLKYPENGWVLCFWMPSPVGGKYSPQAHHSHLKFGTFIHTYAKQTPGEQNALPIPTGTRTSTFTCKCQARGRHESVPKLLKKCSLKSLKQAKKSVKLSFWGQGTKRRAIISQNLQTSWHQVSLQEENGTCTSCPAPLTIQGTKSLVHYLHNKLLDPWSSPLPLNCEMTCVIPVKNESY